MSTFGEALEQLEECGSCGAPVHLLPPGHRMRCEAERSARRRRSLITAVMVLVLFAVLLLALPAQAQSLDPSQLQQGFTTAPLATSVVVLLVAVGYLFRELRAVERARIEDLTASFERLIAMNEAVARLSHDALDAVEVVERLTERHTSRSP